jgi:malate/lactate dehydrogenase
LVSEKETLKVFSLIAASNAPNIPLENFSAMTRLDHDRAMAQLALKLNIQVDSIKNLCIWGNHSLTQVPGKVFLFSHISQTSATRQLMEKKFQV